MLQFIGELDSSILLFIQEFLRFEWLNHVVVFLTHFGDGGAIWIVFTVLTVVQKKYRKEGIMMAFALLFGAIMTNILIKNLVMRPRPFDAIPELHALVSESGWSFPSGHSTSSMAAGLVMFRRMPHKIGIPALVFAIFICLSRLYVGVHYPTDVIVGILVGTFASVCAVWIVENKGEKFLKTKA